MAYCGDCKEECKVIVVDDGIGSYEFQGFCGSQSMIRLASECCEGDVYEDAECKIPYEPEGPDCDEPDYDEYDVDMAIEQAREYQDMMGNDSSFSKEKEWVN